MAGLVAYGTYVPSWRLEVAGRTRAVASYDEDATSMGVEAARAALGRDRGRARRRRVRHRQPAVRRQDQRLHDPRRAGDRQVDNGRTLALTHNLGGQPGRCVSFVSIVGRDRDER